MPILTKEDLVRFNIESSAPFTTEQILEKLIEEDAASSMKEEMSSGHRYFRAENDILEENFTRWQDPQSKQWHIQPNKANNRIPHPFHRRQVLEKVSYLLKNPITITFGEPETDAEKIQSERIRDDFMDVLGIEFNDLLIDWATGASNKGREWLHVFFDGSEFAYMVMDAREIIPIYETSRQNKLVSLIRYYTITVNESGDEKERIRVEWYFEDRVEVYQQDQDGDYKLEETRPHFPLRNTATGSETPGSWGRVPFIELANNTSRLSDLRFIKAFVDAYDLQDSKMANDLEDIQDALLVAIGVGNNPSEIRYNAKMHKVIAANVGNLENLDLRYLTTEIPHEAKKMWMEKAEKNISTLGMSIDPTTETFGQNPSGVALNWLYLPLDLKAGLLARKMEFALYDLFSFVQTYFEIIRKNVIKPEQVKQFNFTFNKNMISNNREQIELANNSVGKISEKTRLENDPRVDDVDAEIHAMEEDRLKVPVDGADDNLGKIPLAVQQLALAKQRAIDTGNNEEANAIGDKIKSLLQQITTNGNT